MSKDSRQTSQGQVPALHKWAVRHAFIDGHDVVLDYGSGRDSKGRDYLYSQCPDILVHEYDPYWKPNEQVLTLLARNSYDVVLCANVLNVIEDDGELQEALSRLAEGCGGTVLFSVYEGNRSGKGNHTTRGWQRNLTANGYELILSQYFNKVERRNGHIYICKAQGCTTVGQLI